MPPFPENIVYSNNFYSSYFEGAIDISGHGLKTNGQLWVQSDASFNSNVVIGNNLDIAGNNTVSSNLYVLGDVSLNQKLYVSGVVTADGLVSMGSKLYVVDDATAGAVPERTPVLEFNAVVAGIVPDDTV